MRSVDASFLLAMFLAAVLFGTFDWAVFDAFSNHHNAGAVNVRVPRGWKQKLAQHEGRAFEE
jgi:hypothetical protein